LTAPKVQTFLEGKQIRKVIVVPERLENIVYSWSSKSLQLQLLGHLLL